MSAKRGERILGPYEHPYGWRVITIDTHGGSTKAGALRRGLVVLNGGVQALEKKAQ